MMIFTSIIIKAAVVFALIVAASIFSLFQGKKIERNSQLQRGVEDALETNKRRNKRRNDSDEVVVKRMKKYVRK